MKSQQPALTIYVFNNEDILRQIFSFTSGLLELSILATVSQKWHRSINTNWGAILAKTVEKNMKNIASGIEMVGDVDIFLNNMLHGYDYRISGSLCLRAIIDEKWYKTTSERIGTDLDIFIRITSITEAHTIIASFFKHLQIDSDVEDDQIYDRTWMPQSTREQFICVKTFYTDPHPIQLIFVKEDTLSFIQRFDFTFLMNSITWRRGFELTIAAPNDIAGKVAKYGTLWKNEFEKEWTKYHRLHEIHEAMDMSYTVNRQYLNITLEDTADMEEFENTIPTILYRSENFKGRGFKVPPVDRPNLTFEHSSPWITYNDGQIPFDLKPFQIFPTSGPTRL